VNAALEPWGEFGKGWQQEKCYVAMTSPYYVPFIAVPRAWTGSTPGKKPIDGEVIMIKAKDTIELMQYAGKLKGKIVMVWSPAVLKPSFDPDAKRIADSSLEKMAKSVGATPGRQRFQGDSTQRAAMMNRQALQRKMNDLFIQEQPALVLSMNQSAMTELFL
jgi:plasmid replication initiation protein